MHFSCGVSGERGYEKSFLQMAFSELVVHSGPLLADAVHEIMQFLVGGKLRPRLQAVQIVKLHLLHVVPVMGTTEDAGVMRQALKRGELLGNGVQLLRKRCALSC